MRLDRDVITVEENDFSRYKSYKRKCKNSNKPYLPFNDWLTKIEICKHRLITLDFSPIIAAADNLERQLRQVGANLKEINFPNNHPTKTADYAPAPAPSTPRLSRSSPSRNLHLEATKSAKTLRAVQKPSSNPAMMGRSQSEHSPK